MFSRILSHRDSRSFFLFGPRGTGKSSWLKERFSAALYFDLLDAETHDRLLANPSRLEDAISTAHRDWIVIDEVQKIPRMLDQVHRLIETRKCRFALSGSSARKLKRGGANLLAGRAATLHMLPLTAAELGSEFRVERSIKFGHLPMAVTSRQPQAYLRDYVHTYLKEEVQNEGLTRNISSFARFWETMALSNGQPLNISSVARNANVERKTTEEYVTILEDLMLGARLPVFSKRAKQKTVAHPKFYFFDVGVFRTLRPLGPLDSDAEIDGASMETLFLQEAKAYNAYDELGYSFSYWRTQSGAEVDFVLYGERGLLGFEVKRTSQFRSEDLAGLRAFRADYPMARAILLYGGRKRLTQDGCEVIPFGEGVMELRAMLNAGGA